MATAYKIQTKFGWLVVSTTPARFAANVLLNGLWETATEFPTVGDAERATHFYNLRGPDLGGVAIITPFEK